MRTLFIGLSVVLVAALMLTVFLSGAAGVTEPNISEVTSESQALSTSTAIPSEFTVNH